jgi:hypothetical protein
MKPKTTIPYYHTKHGPEIFPRRRTFTPDETQWRKATVSFLWERLQSAPASSLPAGILREPQATYHIPPSSTDKEAKNGAKRELRERLTEILLTLRVINEILKMQFGSPDWGNLPHAIDELISILLTRRSKMDDAVRHLKAIREKFRAYYRQQQQTEHLALDGPIAIDVFCGAGGFSLGLRRADFKIVAAIDNNPDAVRTYRLNDPDIPNDLGLFLRASGTSSIFYHPGYVTLSGCKPIWEC